MSFRHARSASLAAGLLFAASVAAFAQHTPGQATQATAVKPLSFVSPVFSDNMVLLDQRATSGAGPPSAPPKGASSSRKISLQILPKTNICSGSVLPEPITSRHSRVQGRPLPTG